MRRLRAWAAMRRLPAAALLPSLLLALAACATPVARLPAVDRDRAEAEAKVQNDLVARGLARWHRAAPKGDQVDRDLAEADRLVTVGWRVLAGALPLCPRHERQVGALFETIHEVPDELRPAFAARFGIDNEPMVAALAGAGPGLRAGLKVGDLVVAVDGKPLPSGGKAVGLLLDRLAREQPTTLSLRRGGAPVEIALAGETVCGARLGRARWAGVNAFADGARVVVTSGLLRAFDDDDQLANAIGHELAHNMMGHLDKQAENARTASHFGTLLKVITGAPELEGEMARVGSRAFSQSFEAEADYVGLYMAAAAGFDPAKAPAFWRRMAVLNPATISHAVSHPTSPARFVALEDTAREIAAKRGDGRPLVPELK